MNLFSYYPFYARSKSLVSLSTICEFCIHYIPRLLSSRVGLDVVSRFDLSSLVVIYISFHQTRLYYTQTSLIPTHGCIETAQCTQHILQCEHIVALNFIYFLDFNNYTLTYLNICTSIKVSFSPSQFSSNVIK